MHLFEVKKFLQRFANLTFDQKKQVAESLPALKPFLYREEVSRKREELNNCRDLLLELMKGVVISRRGTLDHLFCPPTLIDFSAPNFFYIQSRGIILSVDDNQPVTFPLEHPPSSPPQWPLEPFPEEAYPQLSSPHSFVTAFRHQGKIIFSGEENWTTPAVELMETQRDSFQWDLLDYDFYYYTFAVLSDDKIQLISQRERLTMECVSQSIRRSSMERIGMSWE